MGYGDVGDEWVTSALKWIAAVTKRVTITCSAEGDELTSVVKITRVISDTSPPFQ